MDINKLESEIAKFIWEIGTEDRLVRVGLKNKLETAKIYKKYAKVFDKKNLAEISLVLKKSSKSKTEIEIAERLYFCIIANLIGLLTAAAQDKITTYFANAKVKIRGENIPYFQIAPLISKESIFEKREQLADAANKVVAKIKPKQLQLLKDEIKLLKNLNFKGYIDYFEKSKKTDYHQFYKVIAKIKAETDALWEKEIQAISLEVFKRPFKKIRSCHLLYLRSMSMFDSFYSVDKVVPAFSRMAHDLGFADSLSSIKIDSANRPRKNPRAVCYWPNPPKEVHLVIKPIGGEQDFEAMLHEGGHALHGASCNPKLPYTLRALARSNALTETYAFIFEDLVFEPAWLTSFLNISAYTGERIKKHAYFVNLMMLRRYLGKFTYEYQMFSSLLKGRTLQQGPTLYKRNLEETTGFVTPKINWLVDMDSGFYSAEYLRAWIAAAQIKDYLAKKFGKIWFANKKAGKFLLQLLARGVTDEIEDVVKKLGYKPWDTSFLVEGYKKVLA